MRPSAVVFLCSTCDQKDFDGARQSLQMAVDAAGLPVQVRAQACLNTCAEPVSLAIQSHDKATYLFAGLDPVADQADILATVAAYFDSPEGWIEDATVCGRLRQCLKGRVPAFSSGS